MTGLAQIEFHVEASNTRAIRFYEGAGFEICDRLPRTMRREGQDYDDFDMWDMWLDLDAEKG